MTKYIQKHTVLEAIQFTGTNFEEVVEFTGRIGVRFEPINNPVQLHQYICYIPTELGEIYAHPGYYISRSHLGIGVWEKEAFENNFFPEDNDSQYSLSEKDIEEL